MSENTSQTPTHKNIISCVLAFLGLIVLFSLLWAGALAIITRINNNSIPPTSKAVQPNDDYNISYLNEIPSDSSVLSIAWSPDGTVLAASHEDKTVRLWNATTYEIIAEKLQDYRVDQLAWSPDGTKLLFTQNNGRTVIWDVTDRAAWDKERTLIGTRCAAWSADGSMIASGSTTGKVNIWDTTTWEKILEIDGDTGSIESIAWSPNRSMVAFGGKPSGMQIWEIANNTDETNQQTTYSATSIFGFPGNTLAEALIKEGLAWSPDGNQIATNAIGYEAKIWVVPSGENFAELIDFNGKLNSIAWSPDGTFLATGSKTFLFLWTTDSNTIKKSTMVNVSDQVNSIDWSPGSTMLAFGTDDGTIHIWEIP